MPKHDLDAELVRRMADLLDETGLTELEYATQALRIRVARAPAQQAMMAAPMPIAAAPVPTAAEVQAVSIASGPPAGSVTSPMVGTVYIAPEPGAPPFIKIGDSVRQGQTLLIIEAMKVMNPLPAPRSGRVSQIFVADGQPVEFGEALVVIE